MQIQDLSLNEIIAGDNDRKDFETAALVELATSIANVGLAQPITVIWDESRNKYIIVAGERRFRAHGGYTEQVLSGAWPESPHCRVGYIKALIRNDLTPEQASEIMLIENIQRVDLDPIAEGSAYQKRISELNWSIAKLAEVVKKSAETIKSRLKLLALADDIQALIQCGQLKPYFGEEIAELDHDRQFTAIDWLKKQAYIPTRAHVREFVATLMAQPADSFFDFNSLFAPSAVEVAQSDSGKRVSDCLPKLAHLPELPEKQGDAGKMTDAYIAALLADGHTFEAHVLLDFWRKMMKSNKLQVKPWDSHVLPLLQTN